MLNSNEGDAPSPEDGIPADGTNYDATANDETAKEVEQTETTVEDKDAPAEPPAEEGPSAEVTAVKAELEEEKQKAAALLVRFEELLAQMEKQAQEEVPNLVLARAIQDASNIISSRKEIEDIKSSKAESESVVNAIAQAMLKSLGGN
jgi:molecular chaperone GrpE (heat shock protein)